jgi:hypothetical protein
MPLSMDVLPASVTLQVSVDDWPRSIDEGSAPKVMLGAGGGGGGGAGFSTTGAGGGGGGGAFFLQPAAIIVKARQMPMVPILR